MPSLSFYYQYCHGGYILCKNVGIEDLRYYVTNNKAIYYSRDHLSTLSQNCNIRVKSHLITIIIIISLWMAINKLLGVSTYTGQTAGIAL